VLTKATVCVQYTPMNETLYIDNLLDKEVLSINERRELWNQHKARLAPIVVAFQKISGAETRFPNWLDLSLSGDKHKLAEAVRILRTRGFKTQHTSPKPAESSWCAWFESSDCPVRIWLTFSSTVCRRVKIGTKTVEQDVYETVCDELTLPEAK